MARRLSRSEKGKWQAPELPAKRIPVRIPANDNDDLIESNRLTIIGRLTNTVIRKPRAVLDFMAQIWNLEGRIEGRTLGLDKFQIKFKTEEELSQVLEKGPYHYKRWMLLLQRWKPVVSELFPSTISFHVKIHGIPLHYWSEATILTIRKELGPCVIKDEKEAKIWVEVDGLNPLIMKMEIELPTDDVTEVEFEYIKIEKHCFTCFSLFHEESDCPHKPLNALPPKERKLGITQYIALQRIEAEKKRHDDRRGYRRTDDYRSSFRQNEDSFTNNRGFRTSDRAHYERREDQGRDHSILSRTARSGTASYRNNPPIMQYRVVEKSRHNSDSSNPQFEPTNHVERGAMRRTSLTQTDRIQPAAPRTETPPARSINERLGIYTKGPGGSNSGSKDRRSALERISEPAQPEQVERVSPSFESGRLQLIDASPEVNDHCEQEVMEELPPPISDRIPAALRLGGSSAGITTRRGTIPIASQSKVANKRKVTKTPIRKRIARSPLLGLTQRKGGPSRVTSATRRKLVVDKDTNVPCNKAGPSSQRKKNGQPTTVFIPGSTRGGVDFRPHQNSLP